MAKDSLGHSQYFGNIGVKVKSMIRSKIDKLFLKIATKISRTLDIIQLNSIFSSLVRLETEISLHTEAVLSGGWLCL